MHPSYRIASYAEVLLLLRPMAAPYHFPFSPFLWTFRFKWNFNKCVTIIIMIIIIVIIIIIIIVIIIIGLTHIKLY